MFACQLSFWSINKWRLTIHSRGLENWNISIALVLRYSIKLLLPKTVKHSLQDSRCSEKLAASSFSWFFHDNRCWVGKHIFITFCKRIVLTNIGQLFLMQCVYPHYLQVYLRIAIIMKSLSNVILILAGWMSALLPSAISTRWHDVQNWQLTSCKWDLCPISRRI